MAGGKTLYDKLWDSHVVSSAADGSDLVYMDRHLLHEVSTPQSSPPWPSGAARSAASTPTWP